jgi:23S rRNA pseudouridine2605 synthase
MDDTQAKSYNTRKPDAFHVPKHKSVKQNKQTEKPDGPIRLNKYLSNAGIASRREADQLIQSGAVKVNGQVIDQLGYKINPGDQVVFNNQNIMHERKVYLLLNKPKDCITTSDDPRGRKTVMDYIQGACKERVYPVGRLDRNTTGVLLLTNDGDLTTRLTHPKHGIRKIYHVTLNRNLKPEDFKQLVDGVELEDGPMKADDISFDGTSRREVGIELHSGRNRIVRRMFEHLGYEVVKLDRVMFAGLTKKELSRGHYRLLSSKEVAFLKMLS